ncbi:MAG: cytochrome c maturation protein CcmE [Acidobacteria bacterium]|nr:cytochrome c maturation protein CcmE [Acidobacteriota bacterium]
MSDPGDLDLTPRSSAPRRNKPWVALAIVAALTAAIFLLLRGLGDESLFFRSVDEAIEQRDSLNDRQFRLQGVVVPGTVTETFVEDEPGVAFTVEFDQERADVIHKGDPALLFQDGIPVVLNGRWREGSPNGVESFPCGANDEYWFESTQMLVKHDNEYVAANPENIAEADRQLDILACDDAT